MEGMRRGMVYQRSIERKRKRINTVHALAEKETNSF
jgi:hypothetical protein